MKELTERIPGRGGKTIWLDLDNTLMQHTDEWRHEGFAPPHPRALPLLKKLKALKCRINIFSSRTDRTCLKRSKKQVQINIVNIQHWLNINGLAYFIDDIWPGPKPLGIIIDDRAVQFDDDEDVVIDKVKTLMKQWKEAGGTFAEQDCSRIGFFGRLRQASWAAGRVWWYQFNTLGGNDGKGSEAV